MQRCSSKILQTDFMNMNMLTKGTALRGSVFKKKPPHGEFNGKHVVLLTAANKKSEGGHPGAAHLAGAEPGVVGVEDGPAVPEVALRELDQRAGPVAVPERHHHVPVPGGRGHRCSPLRGASTGAVGTGRLENGTLESATGVLVQVRK